MYNFLYGVSPVVCVSRLPRRPE